MILKGFQKNKLNLVVIILLSFCFYPIATTRG